MIFEPGISTVRIRRRIVLPEDSGWKQSRRCLGFGVLACLALVFPAPLALLQSKQAPIDNLPYSDQRNLWVRLFSPGTVPRYLPAIDSKQVAHTRMIRKGASNPQSALPGPPNLSPPIRGRSQFHKALPALSCCWLTRMSAAPYSTNTRAMIKARRLSAATLVSG